MTDVVGKGVPVALCMSMVKYGLETLVYAYKDPSYVLEVINRVIEKVWMTVCLFRCFMVA